MERPLRFCMVTTFYPPYHFGGDGMHVYRLANGLARRGHSVDVIHCLDAYYLLKPSEPEKVYENHPNVSIHSLKDKMGFLSPLLTQQTGYPVLKAKKIKHIIDEGKFDVIHFHNISLVGGPKILEYGHALKLYTLHEYWLICPTHALFKFNREACTKPTCIPCELIHKRPPQMWRYTGMMDKALKSVDSFISPSRFTADLHSIRGMKMPIAHIPMFLPEPSMHPDKAKIMRESMISDEPYFLFVGRLEKIKGLQEVIPVFDEYKKAKILIVGTGRYQEKLRHLATGNQRVEFLGELPFNKLIELYANAVAVIVPSLCYETFCHVIIESFSVKTPVIAKNIGALREVVEESHGGYLYHKGSELISAMEKLRTDPKLRKSLGEKGHAAYRRLWTEEKYLNRYFELIAELDRSKRVRT